jgi:hypothetical protein
LDLGGFGVDLSMGDAVMSWLRLQQASNLIPHPLWCEWGYGSTLTLLGLCRWGWTLAFLGVSLSWSDVVIFPWLTEATTGFRLDLTSIYLMYRKCFGTLIYGVNGHMGSPLCTLLGLRRWGLDLESFGVDLSMGDVGNVMVEATTGFKLDPTPIMV